jgi:hypothetical protein
LIRALTDDRLHEHIQVVIPGHNEANDAGRQREIIPQENWHIVIEDRPDQADAEESEPEQEGFPIGETWFHASLHSRLGM